MIDKQWFQQNAKALSNEASVVSKCIAISQDYIQAMKRGSEIEQLLIEMTETLKDIYKFLKSPQIAPNTAQQESMLRQVLERSEKVMEKKDWFE